MPHCKQLRLFGLLLMLTVTLSPFDGHTQPVQMPLPPTTLVPHYLVAVTYNSTTVLIFPSTVRPIDRGDRDVLAERQPGTENVLKLKAARRNFAPTNLHVFTADGRIYAFDVFYSDSLATTHDLTRLSQPGSSPVSEVLLADGSPNAARMAADLASIRSQHPEFSTRKRHYQMELRLEGINMSGPLLFFRFRIANHSTLDFTPDFVRLFITDQSRAKRTSRQDQELTPVYADTLAAVPGNANHTLILAIPRITIPDQKEFRIELYERAGGRSLSLRIRNRQLLRARPLSPANSQNDAHQ